MSPHTASGWSRGFDGEFEADSPGDGDERGKKRISAKGQGAIEALALDARGIGLPHHSNQIKDKGISNL